MLEYAIFTWITHGILSIFAILIPAIIWGDAYDRSDKVAASSLMRKGVVFALLVPFAPIFLPVFVFIAVAYGLFIVGRSIVGIINYE